MNLLFSLSLLLAATAGSPSPVVVAAADGDWSKLPRLEARGYDHLNSDFMVRLHQIASQGQCRLPGYSGNRLDLRLSFARSSMARKIELFLDFLADRLRRRIGG